jgi:hypothetical protein
MKLPTSDNDALREYYKMLHVTPESELALMWEEISEKDWWYWIEVVAPAKNEPLAFATGEPTCDGVNGTIHETCVEINGRYFRRPATIELFDRARYVLEIQNKFQ